MKLNNVILLLALFVVIILSILLFMNIKKKRQEKLVAGICPSCGAEEKVIKTKDQTLTIAVIDSKVLKSHGCSGVSDVEFRCKECGLKEVHAVPTHCACGI
jgi:predicted RNA-binding Zn-ribbon protein involved in translation (DUF1610 family)